MGDLAGQREVVSETLQLQIIQGVTLLSKTLREDRKVSERFKHATTFLSYTFSFSPLEMPQRWHHAATDPQRTALIAGTRQAQL